jgi:very-short-patch-repair endonuclease
MAEVQNAYGELAAAIAGDQAGVASRRQLVRAGVPRWFLRNELRQRRWQSGGRQTVVVHNGPVGVDALRWIAVLEVGRRAALDGVTALQQAGVAGLDDTVIHVSTPRGSTPGKPSGVKVHETRRFVATDVLTNGIPRMRPAVAAIHAALWARSDRQAKLFVLLAFQQRKASLAELTAVLGRVRRHRRRAVLRQVLAQLAAGSQSLGELDVTAGLRRRGLPVPVQQAVRRRKDGKEYLDCDFPDDDLALEVDGAGHDAPAAKLADLLRDLRLVIEGRQVIRIPLVAWALDEEAVLDLLAEVFRSRGSRPEAAA